MKNRPLPHDLTSKLVSERLRQWLQKCHDLHDSCPKQNKSRLPLRTIDVGTGPESSISLHINPKNDCAAYAAPSYCWGQSMQNAITTRENLEKRIHNICIKKLPRTLQDAITVTRQLGLRYLWVDAICIVQDEEDKVIQINDMASVYKNVVTTITITDATDSTQGFLCADSTCSPSQPVCDLPLILPDGTHGTISLVEPTESWEHMDALGKRGWALQEDFLSPRVIAYKDGTVLKRCRSMPRL